MKKWLLATLALAFTHAYAADSLLERINAHGTVTIGTEGTYAPFTYHDESGKLTGYDVEVARAVADKLGFKVDFKETAWDAMLAGLKAERFDLVANQVALTTPERRATFDKSAEYSYSGPMAVSRADDTRIQALADVNRRRRCPATTARWQKRRARKSCRSMDWRRR